MRTIDIDGSDWMRTLEKRGIHNGRRTRVRAYDPQTSSQGPFAVEVTDWNDASLISGNYWSRPGATTTPYSGWWMGHTVVNDEGCGYQQVVQFRGAGSPPPQRIRTFAPSIGGVRTYSVWAAV